MTSNTDEDSVRQERSDDEKRRVLDDWHRTKSCDIDTVPILIDALQDRADAAEARLQRIAGIVEGVEARVRDARRCGAATYTAQAITMAEISKIYEAAKLDRPVVDPLLEEARETLTWARNFMGDVGSVDTPNYPHMQKVCTTLAKLEALLEPV